MPKPAKSRPGRGRAKRAAGKAPPAAPLVVWPAAPPPPAGPAPAAVNQFEQAMAALQRHAYQEAAELFRAILVEFPREGSLADRARMYLSLCERALSSRPTPPQTVEERLTTATAALNNGDLATAADLARSVLDIDPRHDLALYLLAAVAARHGQTEEALRRLREAIALSPEASAQARHDPDFESLHDLDDFWEITEPPPVETRAGAPRRPRRGRTA